MLTHRIGVVDEDPSYRWSICSALQQGHGCRAELEACTGHEALTMTEAHRPDLVLISRQLPGLNGLQIGAAIRHHFPQTRVIILSPVVSDSQCLEAATAGASGILPRFVDHDALRAAVRSVLHGDDLMEPWAACQDPAGMQAQASAAQSIDLIGALTTRELCVLDCLLMGLSTKEAAATLQIADQTVKNRVSSVLHKLELDSRMAAVRLALNYGWVEYGAARPAAATPNDLKSRHHQGDRGDHADRRPGLVVPPSMIPSLADHLSWG